MDFFKRCWAEVSIDNLLYNFNLIKKKVNTDVMCVVKSNAYGHGDITVVRELEKAGADSFAVATVTEAIRLRKAGINSVILLLGGCLEDCFNSVIDYDVTLAIYDIDYAKKLSDYAVSVSKKAKVHIKLNTGMSRIGFDSLDESDCTITSDAIEQIYNLPGIDVTGVFSHFAVSDEEKGTKYTDYQFDRFSSVKTKVESKGVNINCWHISNSGAILNYPECYLDAVRAGIVLYGLYTGHGYDDSFKQVLSLKTVITHIHAVKKGDTVSYGRTFTADKDMKLATVSIGYADGYSRLLSSKGSMIVNGKIASVVGRVCMDQTIIDVTDIDCLTGDVVTVIGKDGNCEITACDIADIIGTINYEVVCAISSRVPRVYIKDEKQYAVTDYLI